MADVSGIIRRIEAGEKVSFHIGHYGPQWVQFRSVLRFWRRDKIILTAAEIAEVKDALRARRRARQQAA